MTTNPRRRGTPLALNGVAVGVRYPAPISMVPAAAMGREYAFAGLKSCHSTNLPDEWQVAVALRTELASNASVRSGRNPDVRSVSPRCPLGVEFRARKDHETGHAFTL